MVAEGSISSSRCNKKSVVRVAASEIKADNKSSTSTTVAGESEPEKLGVSVPTKKRSFMVDEITEKNNEGLKNVRLHWDLNLPMDAWGQPIDGTEDVVVASDGLKANEAAAGNDKEFQSGCDSQLEDGELKEPYPWRDYKGEAEHGSKLEDEKIFSMVGSNDHKLEESDKRILAKKKVGDASRIREANEGNDSEKHVVVNMSGSHSKGSSSSSRSFGSKPFKVPSHDIIRRRRPDNYELSSGPARRDDRSRTYMSLGREYFSSWDSKRRFFPPNYNRGSFGFERARPKNMVDGRGMVNNYDQSEPYKRSAKPYGRGAGLDGRGARPDDHVRRHFSDGGYKLGQLRKFSDGGARDFKGPYGDTNQMSATKRERGNSYEFRRMNYQQSESRSRSYSPVSWNGRSRSSPVPPGGFRADADQEMSFMSPPRNRMSTPRGENNDNSFRERKSRLGQRFDVGSSMKRPDHSDTNCSCQLRSFISNRRFEDDGDENTGLNRFEIAQLQRTRGSEAMVNGGDDIRRFRFNR